MDQRGGTVSQGGGDSGGGVSQRGGSSHNWSPDGDLVCVSVRGGKGGRDCTLDYCWGGGISYGGGGISYGGGCDGGSGSICRDGGGGSVCCDGGGGSVCRYGGGAEVASRCGGEEERQKNL